MSRILCTGLLLVAPLAHAGERPTASELLRAMDQNLQFDTRTTASQMVVEDPRRTRRYDMVTFGRGKDDAAIEYLAPAREKGTKMLKKGDNLWIYMPRAERTQKISGHMLRQGMMGSDVSYEDMMQAADFEEMYEAKVVGEGEKDGRACWKMEARARDDSVTYPKRVIWIDQEHRLPLSQELFALSGVLLKTWTMSDIEIIEGRPVAKRMEISDALRTGSRTTLIVEKVTFGIKLKNEVFTRRWLERR